MWIQLKKFLEANHSYNRGVPFFFTTDSPLKLCLIYFKIIEINQIKIKGGCQSGRKVVTHNAKSDLPLIVSDFQMIVKFIKTATVYLDRRLSMHGERGPVFPI